MSQFSDDPDRSSETRATLLKIAGILGVSVETLRNPTTPDVELAETRRLLMLWRKISNARDRASLLAMAQHIVDENALGRHTES